MNEAEKALLLVSLQNGIGLSIACEICMLDVEQVSKYMRLDKDFYQKCITAVKISAKDNLEYAQKLKNEKRYNEWHRQQEAIRNFVSDITLWEDYCKRSEIDNIKIMKAAQIYKNLTECATAIGFKSRDLIEHIMDDENLAMYFSQKGIFNL